MYNLKTKKRKEWAVNTGVNDISLDGTKVVTQIYGEHTGNCCILDVASGKQRGEVLKTWDTPHIGKFFMTYYNWTYSNNTTGPSEKLLTTGNDRVNVFDPQNGKHLAELKHLDEEVFLRLTALSRDNRTLLFANDMRVHGVGSNGLVWYFY